MSNSNITAVEDQGASKNADLIAAFAGLLDAQGRGEHHRIVFYSDMLADHGVDVRFGLLLVRAKEEGGGE